MRKVVLIEAVRTPIGKRNGTLSNTRSDELLADTIIGLLKKVKGFSLDKIDEVITGCSTQIYSQGNCIARLSALMAGIPETVPAYTIGQKCSSGEQAIHIATQKIKAGYADVVLVTGVENMSLVPMGSDRVEYSPRLLDKYEFVHQGIAAELIADQWGLTREELDEFSYNSHLKAAAAMQQGKFQSEIVPITVNGQFFQHDEGIRTNPSLEKMAALKPAFKEDGKITAGNSSQISDGAAAALLMEETTALRLGLRPRLQVVSQAVVGIDPKIMLTGVIPATKKALDRAGLTLDDIDVFEINEAFASVVLAWMKELNIDESKVNTRGGAIALGHPTGASGVRITATLSSIMQDTDAVYGLQTMCAAHGMATATVWKKYEEG